MARRHFESAAAKCALGTLAVEPKAKEKADGLCDMSGLGWR